MKITPHPPLLVATTATDPEMITTTPFLHASLWLAVDLDDWAVRRSGHLHLVTSDEDSRWRAVDLARHPLRPQPEVDQATVDDMTTRLLEGLASWDLRFFRIADLEIVSELGEGRGDFRRRAMGLLRPEIQSRIDRISGQPTSRLPWRRHSQEREREAARTRLASALGSLADSIEERRVPDVAAVVRSVELGTLLVPEGVMLHRARHRELMI